MSIKKTFIVLFLIFAPMLFSEQQFQIGEMERYELVKKATYAQTHGDIQQAIDIYLKLHRDDPLNREFLLRLGKLYEEKGDIKQAQAYYEEILRWYGQDLYAELALASIAYDQKKYALAERYLVPIVRLHPDYLDATILLGETYIAQKRYKEAQVVIQSGLVSDPQNVSLNYLMGRIEYVQGEFNGSYRHFKTAWKNSGYKGGYLDQVIGVREYVRPGVELKGEFIQQKEIDLVTNQYTTKMNTWYSSLKLSLPLCNALEFYGIGAYQPEQQYNKISERSNYYINNYYGVAGLDWHYRDYVKLIAQSTMRWGTNKGVDPIFPFPSQIKWEPQVLLLIKIPHLSFMSKVYKEEVIGRNFETVQTEYIDQKGIAGRIDFSLFKEHTVIGANGSVNHFYGSVQNRLKEFDAYFIQKFKVKGTTAQFEYHYLYGNFNALDEEYFSYRGRYRHFGTFKFIKGWGLRDAIEVRYTYKWQKLRDFMNVAEVITPTNIAPPQQLSLNYTHANEFEVKAKFSVSSFFTMDAGAEYYFDTNHYKVLTAKMGLNLFF
ncbi:MAG: tetratricopeptide repeat protein [Simkaniaceae bacterium]|nr:tetratricopeptide repeat protein [Simkaniaceae bacterium]